MIALFSLLATLSVHAETIRIPPSALPGTYEDRYYPRPGGVFPEIREESRAATLSLEPQGNLLNVTIVAPGSMCRWKIAAGAPARGHWAGGDMEFWTTVTGSSACVESGAGHAFVSLNLDSRGRVVRAQVLLRTAHMHTNTLFQSR